MGSAASSTGAATGAPTEVDVLIVGAGLSGIGLACRLRQRCPTLSFRIVEARSDLGGTWDLFRYPGVRSDSDMFTLSYPFRPWRGQDSIADGAEILEYLRSTVTDFGLADAIAYDTRVTAASWSTATQRWTVQADRAGHRETITARFVQLCCGYYDYDHPYRPDFAGQESFAGPIVHPQFWPADLDLAGRRVVVIGSGATAITVVPALAEAGAEVIMLQRSPSYVVSVPRRDRVADRLRRRLPPTLAHHVVRLRNVLTASLFYEISRRRPATARSMVAGWLAEALPPSMIEDHFSPSYGVWDQRLCATPDGDFFRALRDGRASIVTAEIKTLEPAGVRLTNGELIEADVIVTATGLTMTALGGIELEVDGEPVDLPERYVYRGCLIDGVPNLAITIGYVNSSWTLRADLVSRYVCRLLAFMIRKSYGVAVPVAAPGMSPTPLLPLSSGYVRRGQAGFPHSGDRRRWRVRQSYLPDWLALRRADLTKDMFFVARGVRLGRLPVPNRGTSGAEGTSGTRAPAPEVDLAEVAG